MSNDLKKPAEVLAIYKAGYSNRVIGGAYHGSKYMDAKTFFKSMSNSIVYEYERQGFCEFVDYAIDNRIPMDVIVYAAISNAKKYLKGEEQAESSLHIPYVNITDNRKRTLTTWDDFNGTSMDFYVYGYQSVHDTLIELRSAGRKAHLVLLEKNQSSCHNKTTQVIDAAENNAEKINGEANKATERIINTAKAKGVESGQTIKQDEKLRIAEKYLAEGRQTAKDELNDEIASMLKKRDAQIGLIEKLHDDMRDKTDLIHASWSRELTDSIDILSKMRDELYDHIHKWQISLYPYEIEPLAQRYIELYKIINVEKIIEQEILFAYSKLELLDEREPQMNDFDNTTMLRSKQIGGSKEKTVERGEERAEGIEEQIKATIEGLQKLNSSLTIFLKKFEASLNGLGMYVYYPKENEQFDDILHILENGEDGTGLNIKRCIVPGIAKKIKDGDDDDVIIPAIVEV